MDTGRYVIELTHPLYFVLAWASAQLGDAANLIRLPDLIAGVLTIPLVYLVGTRTIGRPAALIATALAVVSPYLIYESNDARAYALATFLVLLTAYLLLRATDDGRARWWVAYGVATTAVILRALHRVGGARGACCVGAHLLPRAMAAAAPG